MQVIGICDLMLVLRSILNSSNRYFVLGHLKCLRSVLFKLLSLISISTDREYTYSDNFFIYIQYGKRLNLIDSHPEDWLIIIGQHFQTEIF